MAPAKDINEVRETAAKFKTVQESLADVLSKYAVPDPKIVSKLPKGGTQLDFVGHADITRILIEIDPCWSWEPIAYDENGLPAVAVVNSTAHMAGRLTIHGVSRIGIGSVVHTKPDLYKELASDFLRNAAMRFGIALNLWTKNEWEDLDHNPAPAKPAPRPAPARQTQPKNDSTVFITEQQKNQFTSACEARGINADQVADKAGVDPSAKWTEADLAKLRIAYKEMSNA